MDRAKRRQIERALKDSGWSFEKRTTHSEVWRSEDGRRFTLPVRHTGDSRNAKSQLCELKRLGVAI